METGDRSDGRVIRHDWTITIRAPGDSGSTGQPAQGQPTESFGRTATGTAGTPGDDVLIGGPGNDALSGLGGNDRIYGGGGKGTIVAGDGNDFVEGNDGNDSLKGGLGDDRLVGNSGGDVVVGARAPTTARASN